VNVSYILLTLNEKFLNFKKYFWCIIIAPNMKQVILVAISLVVIATILPLGLGMIAVAGDTIIDTTTNATLADVLDPSVLTLLTVLLPVLAVIGITMYFLPKIAD